MKDFYEDLWEGLPSELAPPDFALRRSFMLGEVHPGDRVLDLGCGAGQFTRELAAAGALAMGVEVAEAALARARVGSPELDFRLAPIDAPLPLPDHSFDVVWASEVIEHVSDTALWLSEINRVLVPGGQALLSTPSHGRVRLALFGIERFSEPLGDHLHLYTRGSLGTVLGAFGFQQIQIRAVGGPPLLRRMLLARAVSGDLPERVPG
jgi:SAM-dependent methyltransferase